jgi:hypothetical protein
MQTGGECPFQKLYCIAHLCVRDVATARINANSAQTTDRLALPRSVVFYWPRYFAPLWKSLHSSLLATFQLSLNVSFPRLEEMNARAFHQLFLADWVRGLWLVIFSG